MCYPLQEDAEVVSLQQPRHLHCNTVSPELFWRGGWDSDTSSRYSAEGQSSWTTYSQRTSTPTSGNVLPSWAHYLAQLICVSQPFPTWKSLSPSAVPPWLMSILKSAWGWLSAATVRTMHPWLSPFSASHQSKVMTKNNVQSCIVNWVDAVMQGTPAYTVHIKVILNIFINNVFCIFSRW